MEVGNMVKQQNIYLLTIILILVCMSFACGLGGSSEPAQPPSQTEPTLAPAEPTNIPEEPTDVPEPTATITEEPTEESAGQLTDSSSEEPPVNESEAEEPPPYDEIYIKTINGYRDELGYLHVVGLVTNNTDRTVESIEVEVNVLDGDGNTLLAEINMISLYSLAPGETSPFTYWVSEDLSDAKGYSATIVGQSASEIERAIIKVDGDKMEVDDNGDVHITGKLVNNTINPILIESLAAATFDENGQIITADSHSVIVRHLDPGEDGPFRVSMTGPDVENLNIAEYNIYVDAQVADPVEIFDFTTSDTHQYYIDSYGTFHLVGEVTNNNEEFFTISLVAGIFDEKGNVVDAATTDIPTFSIAPGETLPYDFQYWGPINYKEGMIDTATNYYVQWDPYWTWSSTSEHVELSTENDSNEVGDFQVTFTGDVVNDSGEEVEGATVIVTLYSIESGALVAMGFGGIYEPISPNGTTTYQVWIDTPINFDFDSVEYEIFARGDLP
jgi:hypothetical protein